MAETDKPRRVLNDLNAVRNAPKPDSNLGVDFTTVVNGLDAQKAGVMHVLQRETPHRLITHTHTHDGTTYGVTLQVFPSFPDICGKIAVSLKLLPSPTLRSL